MKKGYLVALVLAVVLAVGARLYDAELNTRAKAAEMGPAISFAAFKAAKVACFSADNHKEKRK